MVVLAVTWIANAGREAETAGLFRELAIESRKEPGCVMYMAHQHRTEPARFLIYEQYKDDAALDTHRAAPHFLKYVKNELIKVAVRVEGNLYSEL
jgi:quinol monooxygenase YgiN